MNGPGMEWYHRQLVQARKDGLINGPLGLDDWKPASKATLAQIGRKEKAKQKKAKRRKATRAKAEKAHVDLFALISLVRENGDFNKLVPHCGKGVTIKSLLEWHEQEVWARNLKERRKLNNGE